MADDVPTIEFPCAGHVHRVPIDVVLDALEPLERGEHSVLDGGLSCVMVTFFRERLARWLAARDALER